MSLEDETSERIHRQFDLMLSGEEEKKRKPEYRRRRKNKKKNSIF